MSQPMYLLVSSANATNSYGNRRSYRIQPLTMSRLMLPQKHVIGSAANWAKHHVRYEEYLIHAHTRRDLQ